MPTRLTRSACLAAFLVIAGAPAMPSSGFLSELDGFTIRPATAAGVTADAAAAAVSAYRKSRGLGPVTVDPKLTAIAARHAKAMANRNKMAHVLFGEFSFAARLSAGGYRAEVAVENIAAGPTDLDQAMAAWKKSPQHNANLLDSRVVSIGIAVAHTDGGKYHEFWSMVLAAPDKRALADVTDAPPATNPAQ
jgi:uncharacterized protein YkwD